LTSMPLGLAIATAIMVALKRAGAPLVYLLGGWAPPAGHSATRGWAFGGAQTRLL